MQQTDSGQVCNRKINEQLTDQQTVWQTTSQGRPTWRGLRRGTVWSQQQRWSQLCTATR